MEFKNRNETEKEANNQSIHICEMLIEMVIYIK